MLVVVVVDITGRKLVDDGNTDVVVVPAGVGNVKGPVVVDDGVENEKAEVSITVAGVDKEKDGTA